MRPAFKFLLLILPLAFFWNHAPEAQAKTSGFCLECHTRNFLRQTDASAIGERSVYAARMDPCPGIRSLAEESFFTENRISRLNEILQNLDKGAGNSLTTKIGEAAESFSDLKRGQQASIGRFAKDTFGIRAGVQKVYDQTLRERGESTHRLLIGLACLLFIGLLFALGVGYRKLNRWNRTLLLFLFLGGGLAVTGCSAPSATAEKKSPAQEQMDRALSAASQVSGKMEEGFERAILLADMSHEWAKTDKAAAARGFQLAWQTALKAREQAGRAAVLNEVAARCPTPESALKQKVDFNTVLDLRDEIRQADARTWALRAVAEQWIEADPKKGREALEFTTQEALKIQDAEVRDRELMGISQAWVALDRNRALEIARSIRDPLPKAAALRGTSASSAQLEEAWKTAESIPAEYARVKTMIAISAASAAMDPAGSKVYAERISSQTQGVKNPGLRSFLFQELVRTWAPVGSEQAERWAAEIDPKFPSSRSYAFLHVGQSAKMSPDRAVAALKKSIAEAEKNPDSFEASKVGTLALETLAGIDAGEVPPLLGRIRDIALRSEILLRLAGQVSARDKTRALDLASKIPLEPFRMKTMTGIVAERMPSERDQIEAILNEAGKAASSIPEPSEKTLAYIELGKIWGKLDKGRQASLLEEASKTALQMNPGSAQTEAFESLGDAWKNFDRNKYQAFTERIRSRMDQTRKPLEEIRLWAGVAPHKAKDWAEALPSAFPLERAAALRESASALKNIQPGIAAGISLQALSEVLAAPEGTKRNRLVSLLAGESALLDKEKTFVTITRIKDVPTRDFLLRDAGNAWVSAEPAWAIKAAGEISDSGLRLALYQKIADRTARALPPGNGRSGNPYLLAFYHWGTAREKAKREETRAIPHLQNALPQMERISDARARAYLLSALAVEWARLDEGMALRILEKIPADLPECSSYALTRVGGQLRKWNRKEAESVFSKAHAAAGKISDPSLQGRRLLQLGQEWQALNRETGETILKKAERQIRQAAPLPMNKKVLAEILSAETDLNPSQTLALARNAGDPSVQAGMLIQKAGTLYKASIEENLKILDRAWQYAQKSKNPRLAGEIGRAWFSIDPVKGAEILAQVEPRGSRITSLLQIARTETSRPNDKVRALELAGREIPALDGAGEKLKALRETAAAWSGVNPGRARDLYLEACRISENELASLKNSF